MNKKLLVSGAIAAATVVGAVGGATLTALQSFAATDSVVTAQVQPKIAGGQHVGTNGVKEELLTGDTAEKVKTAALKANPGGIIQRVETDVEGSVYEAHMTKSDGSRVTVKFDANFGVTSTERGQH